MLDVIIIGGGPAGLNASLYARRAGLSVVILEKLVLGGQVGKTHEVENYIGIDNILGPDLVLKMEQHARRFGADIKYEEVIDINFSGIEKEVITKKNVYRSKTVIIATGSTPRYLNVPGEKEFAARGVSYCATCDGNFFKKKITAVVGGGNTALEDAIFLSRICDQVYLIHRRDKFRADQILVDAINKIDNIKPIYDTVVSSIKGDKFVNKIAIKTGDVEREIDVSAVFIAIGNVPNNGIFKGKLDLSEGDYIKVDEHLRTSELGVFAAGDGRVTPLRQIITAAADGALAAFSASVYLAK